MKTGLVLEGGAMRGLWTAGVVQPDGLIGVSAGAAFGCNYKSHQIGRAIRYNTRFAKDPRYSGWKSLLKSGDYYNANFGYHVVPFEYDKFDIETFEKNPLEFTVVCTDVETGQPVYHKMDHVDYNELEWLRASAVADSIPLEYYEKQGYKRNVVILTQPLGYRKKHLSLMPLMRLALRKYPHFLKALDERHLMYNCQLDYVAEAERLGRCLVIRPDENIPIGHLSHDAQQMRHVYELGRAVGERYIDRIKEFYNKE